MVFLEVQMRSQKQYLVKIHDSLNKGHLNHANQEMYNALLIVMDNLFLVGLDLT